LSSFIETLSKVNDVREIIYEKYFKNNNSENELSSLLSILHDKNKLNNNINKVSNIPSIEMKLRSNNLSKKSQIVNGNIDNDLLAKKSEECSDLLLSINSHNLIDNIIENRYQKSNTRESQSNEFSSFFFDDIQSEKNDTEECDYSDNNS